MRWSRLKKSRAQECHYHAVIGEIARAKGVEKELAKRILIARFREETERDPEFSWAWGAHSRSRDFTKVLASAFTDFCYAWKAHHVVEEPSQSDESREGSP